MEAADSASSVPGAVDYIPPETAPASSNPSMQAEPTTTALTTPSSSSVGVAVESTLSSEELAVALTETPVTPATIPATAAEENNGASSATVDATSAASTMPLTSAIPPPSEVDSIEEASAAAAATTSTTTTTTMMTTTTTTTTDENLAVAGVGTGLMAGAEDAGASPAIALTSAPSADSVAAAAAAAANDTNAVTIPDISVPSDLPVAFSAPESAFDADLAAVVAAAAAGDISSVGVDVVEDILTGTAATATTGGPPAQLPSSGTNAEEAPAPTPTPTPASVPAPAPAPAPAVLAETEAAASSTSGDASATAGEDDSYFREQDRYLPIANVARIMKMALPEQHGKIARDAKECVQEAVSEFVCFITSEASERCISEKRKTISSDDILVAMQTLGFDDYIEPLREYMTNFRAASQSLRNTMKRTAEESKATDSAELSGFNYADQNVVTALVGDPIVGGSDSVPGVSAAAASLLPQDVGVAVFSSDDPATGNDVFGPLK